jgi:hypothetical protein
VKVEVSRSGGLMGRTVRWAVVLEDLPDDDREAVTALLEQAPAWASGPSRGADRFTWRVRTTEVDVSFGDPPPDPASRLVELVRSHGED